jgi:hypothetical protein
MVNLHFPKGGLDPKGFETATVGQKVTVTITAIVRRVEDSADHWDPGKRMGLEMTACSIQGPAQAPSLNKALTSAKRTV